VPIEHCGGSAIAAFFSRADRLSASVACWRSYQRIGLGQVRQWSRSRASPVTSSVVMSHGLKITTDAFGSCVHRTSGLDMRHNGAPDFGDAWCLTANRERLDCVGVVQSGRPARAASATTSTTARLLGRRYRRRPARRDRCSTSVAGELEARCEHPRDVKSCAPCQARTLLAFGTRRVRAVTTTADHRSTCGSSLVVLARRAGN
jgi:hypothetical protein